MTSPIVTCRPGAPLGEVAALMSRERIHAVVVRADDGDPSVPYAEMWRLISEIDLMSGLVLDGADAPAGRVAADPVVVVDAEASVDRAAALMVEFGVSHLVAVGPDGDPVGIVSCLDVAGLFLAGPATA